jgi:hypothetical protein
MLFDARVIGNLTHTDSTAGTSLISLQVIELYIVIDFSLHVRHTAYTMAHMIRKQIYLTQELDQHIHVISQKENKPEAKVIVNS